MKKINKKGLTLIELLAVIAIIAILFVLLIPQINSAIEKARIAGVQTDLHSYQLGVKSYLMEHNDTLPNRDQLNINLDSKFRFNGTDVTTAEMGPWGNPYVLSLTTGNGTDHLGGNVANTTILEVYTLDNSDLRHSVRYIFRNGEYVYEYYQYGVVKEY